MVHRPYLTDPPQRRDPRASPLLSEDLTGTCPTIVVTAGCDILRDEGREYAVRLAGAGVQVEHLEFPGFVHSFLNATALGDEVVSRLRLVADRFASGMTAGRLR